jgi:hypothetical protein
VPYDRLNSPVSQFQITLPISAKPEIGLAGGCAEGGMIEGDGCTDAADADAIEAGATGAATG